MSAPDDGEVWDAFYRAAGRDALASHARDDVAYYLSGQRDVRRITERFAVPMGGTALEIGCGDGRMTRTLATMFAKVYALDVAPTVLNACRAALVDFTNVQYLLGGAAKLDLLPDRSIDVIIGATVLQHVPVRDEVRWYLSEAARLVSPTGIAVLQLRNPRALTRVHDYFVDAARTVAGSTLPAFHPSLRGVVVDEWDARAATGLPDADVGWFPDRHHVWLTIRRPQPPYPTLHAV